MSDDEKKASDQDRPATPPSFPKTNGVIHYPVNLDDDTDFEAYRKTNSDWQYLLDKHGPVSALSGVFDDEKAAREKRGRTRCIMQLWPRDPNGEVLREMPKGKETNNGLPLWGATLYDFYFVNKIPEVTNMRSIISGSMLAKWMRENGELYAKDYIDQAENDEPEPKLMKPYNIGEFVEFIEEMVHWKKTGRSLKVDKTLKEKISSCLLPPSEYPGRWPLRPFSTPTCRLQERIPLDKLPKKLFVHDPWNCLDGKYHIREVTWGSKPDRVLTYTLMRNLEENGRKVLTKAKPAPDEVSEAHLYISPRRRIGQGNHSYIYQAEWEIPRELVVAAKKCTTCSFEENPIMRETLGDHVKEIFPMKELHAPYCRHLRDGIPRPKTARVSVTAKLTMQYGSEDHPGHLRNEARNYMNFPDHFFEHWNGYNIIRPCHDPLPVGAVVPQFYGYYVPDETSSNDFISPILLLEHCGKQASVTNLTLEERRECWSLLERFHMAGFLHNSVFERNILVQNGPVQWSPFKRSKQHPRFRLIDFGRTEEADPNDKEMYKEGWRMDKNFRLNFIHDKDAIYSS